MDQMTSIATFVRVVDVGGFAAAGRKLNMSPSTVTAHIQSLEARLGVRLLNRSTRKVSVTEVGSAYYERCMQILADLEEADSVVQALQSTPRGKLRLNAAVAIPPLLAPVIAEFSRLYPDVSLSMTMSDRMVDLVEEGFDLAIRLLPIPDSSLIIRRVGTFRLIACAAPEYLARHGIPRVPSDLVNHNCLSFSYSPWGTEWRFSGPEGDQSVPISGNLESNSANALRLAAVQGQGVTMMPSFLVVDEIKSGRLVPILTEFMRTEHPINAVYPHRHQLSAKVRSFLDLMTKHYRENPAWADPCKSNLAPCEPKDADVLPEVQRVLEPTRSSNAAVG
jgi:DNA-binding transcriptional LysR family regulator